MKKKVLISIIFLAASQQVYCLSLKDMLKESVNQALQQPTPTRDLKNETPKQQVSEPTQQQVSEPTQQQVSEPTQQQVSEPIQQQVSEPIQQQVSEPIQQQIKLCISNICVGDELGIHDEIIDEGYLKTEQEVYNQNFTICEKERIDTLKNAEETQKKYGRTRIGDFVISAHKSSQMCVDIANKKKQDYTKAVNYNKATTLSFLKAWTSLSEKDAVNIANAQPATLLDSNDYYGNTKLLGSLLISPKTNIGSFHVFESLPLVCQPIVIQGRMKNGDISFFALQEQESRKFIIIELGTKIENVSGVESSSLAEQYREKFASYYISDRDVMDAETRTYPQILYSKDNFFGIMMFHPLFRGMSHSHKYMPSYLENQFLSITPDKILSSTPRLTTALDFEPKQYLSKDYLKLAACKSRVKTDIQIK